MKKYLKLSMISCLAMMLFTACSSEDIEKGTDVPKNASQIKFSFIEEDFDSDEELTRAAKPEDATQAVKDFGNNLEVEYGLERDPEHSAQDKKAATRAIANAHYTIRAYQGTTLKDEMRGTFNGNTFTPDADSKDVMGLAAGTYDFIAFNDKVTPTATGFTVTQANVATAFIGKAKAVPISGKEMKLAFWMKHVGCRVRVKVNRYAKKIETQSGVMGKFYSTTDVPETVALDYMGENPVVTATRPFTLSYYNSVGDIFDQPEQDAQKSNEWVYSAKTQWQYFLPGTVLSNFKVDLPAYTIYKKNAPAATYSIPKSAPYPWLPATEPRIAESNASYAAKIRLVYTGYKYLFKDGSVGTLKSVVDPTTGRPTKEAIGFVIKENDGTPLSGMAMMLNDADPGISAGDGECSYANSGYSPGTLSVLPAALSEMNGYEKCYGTSTYSPVRNTIVKQAAERQRYIVYRTGTPPASFSEFYVPSVGEWKAFFEVLGFGDSGINTGVSGNSVQIGYQDTVDPVLASYASSAFCHLDIQTGKYLWSGMGTESMNFMGSKNYWTCTEWDYPPIGAPFRVFFNYQGSNIIQFGAWGNINNPSENAYTETTARLRAFVHF